MWCCHKKHAPCAAESPPPPSPSPASPVWRTQACQGMRGAGDAGAPHLRAHSHQLMDGHAAQAQALLSRGLGHGRAAHLRMGVGGGGRGGFTQPLRPALPCGTCHGSVPAGPAAAHLLSLLTSFASPHLLSSSHSPSQQRTWCLPSVTPRRSTMCVKTSRGGRAGAPPAAAPAGRCTAAWHSSVLLLSSRCRCSEPLHTCARKGGGGEMGN